VLQTALELEVVRWVERLVKQAFGIVAGSSTERDGKDDSGLTVDVTFEDADPRLAVEVTRLRTNFERPDLKHWADFQRRLRRFVNRRGAPHWLIGVRPETSFRSGLGPAIERIIEWMLAADLDELGPGTWSRDVSIDVLHRMGNRLMRDFFRDCEDARLKGVILVRRESAKGIQILPIEEFSDSRSLQRPLARAFRAKARSLGIAKAKGYVTILAVDVEREDALGYLREGVRVPDLALAIDHVWLFARESPGGALEATFCARRDQRRVKRLERVEPP
jgi:hypothetical protein